MGVLHTKIVLPSAHDDKHPEKEKTGHKLGGIAKRVFDIAFVVVALPLLLPIAALITLMVKIICGGDVLFRQERIGFDGQPFQCLKFRTMVPDAEERLEQVINSDAEALAEYKKTHKLKDDPRILPFIGNFMRKSSLDELPQFFNVLKGEMSIVGPRPVMQFEFEILNKTHARAYTTARPGITGRWQVSGRNDLDFADRAKLDIAYVRNWSLLYDLKIVLSTIVVLVMRKGAY